MTAVTNRRPGVHTPAPRVHAQLWRHLAAAPEPASASMLASAAGASVATADHRLKLWVAAGAAETAGVLTRPNRRPSRLYRLSPTVEPTPMPPVIDRHGRARPRALPAYQRIWTAIRVLGHFDLPQLQLVTAASVRTMRGYVGLLQRTGYVRLDKLGNPRTGECSRYRLIRNSGPKAPREILLSDGGRPVREFVDPNTAARHDLNRGAPSNRRPYRTGPPPAAIDGGVS